jgi:hypothetical protein
LRGNLLGEGSLWWSRSERGMCSFGRAMAERRR